ncbi:hypothetical protein XENOCAPTIV_007269 [Xenoophorus captivus]|uniref:C2 domain-containing protein n=1 Tax=Xenoophorus captivus TaxID=1517983 RepID=A0ABV0QR85_9TELE
MDPDTSFRGKSDCIHGDDEEKGQVYKQKKPTMYPPWNTTFDAHVHRGRIMHVMVKDRTAELKLEVTVALDSLATRCKKENGKLEIWVSAEAPLGFISVFILQSEKTEPYT